MFKVVLLLVFIASALGEKDPEVTLKQGKLRGYRLTSRKGREFLAFQRIPYAKSPVGDFRFKSPQPLHKWEGVLDATQEVPKCTQRCAYMLEEVVSGQEDCLYLNVFTPKIKKDQPLDVMVYIHGGGFLCGASAAQEPDNLLDKDIVLVTINYRLGPLGFLSTGDFVSPGNNGLKDQVAALRWVRDNIAAFGGNPDSVTIFGESAGGASVHYHVLSPMSQGLFHRAISISGTAFCSWAFAPEGSTVDNTKKLASLLNCPIDDSDALISCLREKDAVDIVATDKSFMEWSWYPPITFPPVLETGEDAFIPAHPEEMLRNLKTSVPWITSVSSAEGAFAASGFYGADLVGELIDDFERLCPITAFIGKTSPYKKGVAQKVKEFYFGRQNSSSVEAGSVVDLFTDAWFLSCADRAVKLHYEAGLSEVYYYYFDYRGSRSFSTLLGDKTRDYGVCHADDLLYLFPLREGFEDYKPTEKDEEMVDILTTLWYNFAHTGNPTPTPVKGVKWSPVTNSENAEYLKIARDVLKKGQGLLKKRVKFWESLEQQKLPATSNREEL